VIQFNFGFYEFPALASLIDTLKNAGVQVLVTFHSTVDPPQLPDRKLADLRSALARCDRLLAHSPGDLNRLKALGLTHNTALLPHGVIDADNSGAQPLCIDNTGMAPANDTAFRVASFGFLLPHKGLEELLDALALLRDRGQPVSLQMLNAEYPAEVSRQAIESIRSQIDERGLEDLVNLDTVYYTDHECLERLADANLVVFPYQATQESSSAAVRHAIASGAPVAVTPLAIFEDVAPAVIELPGCDPVAMANGIEEVMRWPPGQWQEYQARSKAWRAQHAHSVVAQRLWGMIRALQRHAADRAD
jgi:glycosyltransferase involved in cell wall biosynthesis